MWIRQSSIITCWDKRFKLQKQSGNLKTRRPRRSRLNSKFITLGAKRQEAVQVGMSAVLDLEVIVPLLMSSSLILARCDSNNLNNYCQVSRRHLKMRQSQQYLYILWQILALTKLQSSTRAPIPTLDRAAGFKVFPLCKMASLLR